MIGRRPGTWETMSGEEMGDDNSREAIDMADLQQQVKPQESSRSGSCITGWGTCAELLLVGAVKKHGVPNWNLVALELKARANMLNTSPSCFSEEACESKYNALKGQFASSSSSGDGALDEELDGVSWFEELRKLRMSHLKEELEVYDSSIGQLQSRINSLKEERAVQSVMKQYESSCTAGPYVNHDSDLKVSIPTHLLVEPLETSQDSRLEPIVAQADLLSGKVVSGVVDIPVGSEAQDGSIVQKDGAVASTFVGTVEEGGTDVAEPAGSLSAADGGCLASKWVAEVARNGDQVCKDGQHETFPGREGEIDVQQSDVCGRASFPSQAARGISEVPSSAAREDRGHGIANTGEHGNDRSEHHEAVAPHNDEQEKCVEDGVTVEVGPPPVTTSANMAVDIHDEHHTREASKSFLSSEVPHTAPEAECINPRNSKIESSLKKDSRLSKLSLSSARADREKKLKAKEELQFQRRRGPKMRASIDNSASHRTGEAAEISRVEAKPKNDTSLLKEPGVMGNLMPSGNLGTGSTRAEFVPGFSSVSGRGSDRVLESSDLGGDNGPTHVDPRASNQSMVLATRGVSSVEGAERRSLESGTLPSTLSAGPTAEVEHSADVGSLNVKNQREVSQTGLLDLEPAPTEEEAPQKMRNRSSLSGMVMAGVKEQTMDGTQVTDDVKIEDTDDVGIAGAVLKVELEARQVEKVDAAYELGEEQRLGSDLALSRPLGNDDVSETLILERSAHVKEESRDCPETGDVQQLFPDYTDSQIDKSEVGSSLDSIEDMSPSSRRNRREPKVPGKFLPLLECLRVICAHKFAPLFRQRHDYQYSADYDRLVRRHVDLGMVRTRLEEGAYSGSVEFFRDLLLIFTNALVYNSSDSQEYTGAKALRSCALMEMDKILQTEALLKQNGPATRKREVRKSMEVHKMRLSSTSGSEVRKKGIMKGNLESAALDLQGGAKSSQIAFEDTPLAGRSSNNNQEDFELDGRIETVKSASDHAVKGETLLKDLQKLEIPNGGKLKEYKKRDLHSEGKRKDLKKPEFVSEARRKELQKPELLSEGKRKESHKSGLPIKAEPLIPGKRKESQKPELLSAGMRKESQKPGVTGEVKRKELKKSDLPSEAKQKEWKKPEVPGESKGKELQKAEPSGGYRSGVASVSGKKVKMDSTGQKASPKVQIMAGPRASSGHLNVENVGAKSTPAKMKDVMCIDVEKKRPLNITSSVAPSGLPVEKPKTQSILRQTSTSRVSRNSKRGGDSSTSNSKKRARK